MRVFYTTLIIMLSAIFLSAQSTSFWTDVSKNQVFIPEKSVTAEEIQENARLLSLDLPSLKAHLQNAPKEGSGKEPLLVSLPLPDGSMETFKIVNSRVMAPGLAARYPMIQSFSGMSVDNPQVSLRFDYGTHGVNGLIRKNGQMYAIAPYATNQTQYHTAYNLGEIDMESLDLPDNVIAIDESLKEEMKEITLQHEAFEAQNQGIEKNVGLVSLHTYRFALICTGEFSVIHGGTMTSVMSAVNTATNAINAILEPEVASRFELVEEQDALIFLNPDSDPFTTVNSDATVDLMLQQGQEHLTINVGSANYDIGHIFNGSCAGSGIAGVAGGLICSNFKGRALTCHSSSNLINITIRVGLHEMGHQFASGHTFNHCPNSEDQYTSGSAYEPGSGSTILSYGGLCGSSNIGGPIGSYYNIRSLEEIVFFSTLSGGSTCGTFEVTDNNEPELTLNYEDGFYIPLSTPFKLTAEGSDPDGDDITYCWEQHNTGPWSPLGSPILNAPTFRSFEPTSNPTRIFPRMSDVVNNVSSIREVLPEYSRDLEFYCTVRDGLMGGGGTVWDGVAFHATETAGPFLVMHPDTANIAWTGGEVTEVTWDVANTTNSLVDCQLVNIKMSVDGGFTYPYTLMTNTINDGSEFVTVPDISSTSARIMVEAADNIFFDISNTDFEVGPATEPGYTLGINTQWQQICVPDNAAVEFTTSSLLGYDSLITLEIIDGLPEGINVDFSTNPIVPGETTTLTFDMNDVTEDGTFEILVRGVASGADTTYQTIIFNVVYSDFSALEMMEPFNGKTGSGLLPDFSWANLPNSDFYDFQLSTDPSFSEESIVDQALGLVGSNYTPSVGLEQNQLYFWRVKTYNECTESPYLTPFVFSTFTVSCTGFASTDVPKNISAIGLPTISSLLTVVEDGEIADVNVVNLQGDHNAILDIEVSLTDPSGEQEVVLFSGICGNSAPFHLGLDDEAAFNVGDECPPVGGASYIPQNALSAFDGLPTLGSWILKVKVIDDFGDGGTLQNWGLEFCASFEPNAPFLVNNNAVEVKPLEDVGIKKPALLSEDLDNTASELVYTIIANTQYGTLLLDGNPLALGDTLLQSDINSEKLRYLNEDGTAEADAFSFIVEDGTGGWFGTPQFDIIITEDAVNGTSEEELAGSILLFPNPAKDVLNVRFQQGLNESVVMQITDVHGRLLMQDKRDAIQGNVEFDTSNLANGVYFMTIQAEDAIFTKKFTIQK